MPRKQVNEIRNERAKYTTPSSPAVIGGPRFMQEKLESSIVRNKYIKEDSVIEKDQSLLLYSNIIKLVTICLITQI